MDPEAGILTQRGIYHRCVRFRCSIPAILYEYLVMETTLDPSKHQAEVHQAEVQLRHVLIAILQDNYLSKTSVIQDEDHWPTTVRQANGGFFLACRTVVRLL